MILAWRKENTTLSCCKGSWEIGQNFVDSIRLKVEIAPPDNLDGIVPGHSTELLKSGREVGAGPLKDVKLGGLQNMAAQRKQKR